MEKKHEAHSDQKSNGTNDRDAVFLPEVLFTTVLLMSGTSWGLSTYLLDELASTGTTNDPPCPHDLTCIYGMGD